MKITKANVSNLLFLVALLGVALLRLPQLLEHWKLEGMKLSAQERELLTGAETRLYPPADGTSVVIFWATWCAPCKLEMNRLKASVEAGKIPKERLFAISLSEDPKTVASFLEKNPYPFTFLRPALSDEELKIQATPTTVIFDQGKVRSISQGMSLWGIWWLEYLFRG